AKEINLSDWLSINVGAGEGGNVTAPITGNGFIEIRSGDHSFVSLDGGTSSILDSDLTLTGLPGGAPALLPRNNIIQRSSFIAPQGVWLRPNTTTTMQESSFRGKLTVDGAVDGSSLDG